MKKPDITKQVEEAKFVEAKLQGKSNTAAAMVATGTTSKDVAKKQGNRLSTTVNVQQAIQDKLESHNITHSKILDTISEALTATKAIVMGKNSEESFVDLVPDWGARLKAADMSLKLMGAYNPKPKEPNEIPPSIPKEMVEAIKKGDIEALTAVAFKKTYNEPS